jgi:carbon monoxide dehydrogenase subunit G
MILEGEFTFKGSREKVWEMLQDPEVLAKALPGSKRFEKTEEDYFESEMEIRVGPLNDIFSGKMQLKDKVNLESYNMMFEGTGKTGFAKGSAKVDLAEQGDGSTLMTYKAELQVGGRLANVGQRMLDSVGRSMTRQSLDALNNALQAGILEDSEISKDFQAPTQADFAKGVAKDVTRETIQSNKTKVIIGAVIIVAIAIWLILSMVR